MKVQLWMKMVSIVLIAVVGLGSAVGIDVLREQAPSPLWSAILAAIVFLAATNIAARHIEKMARAIRFCGDILIGITFGIFFYAKQTAVDLDGVALGIVNGIFIAVVIVGLMGYWNRRWPDDADPGLPGSGG
ncbi:hypothetical protein [Trueperella pyogenes]|uniref:hypothetical protein n=1 Tax=Trueperella pyogenes TaxID=1661 RepID=UPI00345C6284